MNTYIRIVPLAIALLMTILLDSDIILSVRCISRPHGRSEDDAVDGIEFAKVLVIGVDVLVQWFEAGSSRYDYI
jgi:hypothetical protein